MNFTTLDDGAFKALVKQTVDAIKSRHGFSKPDKWLSGEKAMKTLRIENETVLKRLRNEGKIRFIEPEPDIILYDMDSLDSHLENTPKQGSDENSR